MFIKLVLESIHRIAQNLGRGEILVDLPCLMAFYVKFMNFVNQKSLGGDSLSTLLSDPDSSIHKIVPLSAIAKANKIVVPILLSAANYSSHGCNVGRRPYTKTYACLTISKL